MEHCPDCGIEVDGPLVEGYCQECRDERQSKLNQHHAELNWWGSLTIEEKDRFIQMRLDSGT